ncbi:hypothetical protein CKM354_000852300 [Cercospora kikuchii]|uniref:SET domain-containing protein n=1 Tax=Cercospora kikuchii TaxID=84275 RepID=A0A9P3CRL9_9PEZI|nr:uncharacterized protein CKM354_000852300 [Cercospora kikuchii]GIZ45350.1 hypothetical protein CKM354_000852300 [Cercospora kikuchii]
MDPEAALALVQRERDIFDTASERKGQPRPSNLPTRAELLESFQAAGKDNEQEPFRIIVGHIYPPCTKSLAELEDIAISDLCLETVHHGKRLVLRSIGQPKNEDGALIQTRDLNEKAKKLNGKAYYRAGCAAYHLERFASAASFFENVLELDPKDTEAQSQLRRTKARLDEQASGQYNLELITKKMRKDPKLRVLDHASFILKVEIKNAREKGRGLFATCDLEAGELVMCEKAFCVAGLKEKAEESSIISLLDNTMSTGTHALRLVKVLQKLLRSPKQAARFFELCDGNYQPRPSPALVDGVVPVDAFQVISALKANGFSCPSSASSITMDGEDEGSKCTGVGSLVPPSTTIASETRISAGEELTMRYINPENTIEQFHEQLKRCWNFTCTCRLCTAEVNTPPYQRNIRASLLQQVIELMHPVLESSPPSMETIDQVEKLCKGIESTYNDSLFKALPRTMLHVVHLWLCMAYATQSMGDAMLDAAQLVLRDLGFGISELNGALSVDKSNARLDASGIHAAMYAAQIEEAKGRGGIARQYEELAKELYLLFAGSMYNFAELFPSVF